MEFIFYSLFGTSLALYLFRNWAISHIQNSIKLKYDKELEILKQSLIQNNNIELESYKNEMSRTASILSTVNKTYGEAAIMHQKLIIESVSHLWSRMMQIKFNIPVAFTVLDTLTEKEFKENGRRFYEDMTKAHPINPQDTVTKMGFSGTLPDEEKRIFVGEYIWFIFKSYSTINTRIVIFFLFTTDWRSATQWHKEQENYAIISSVLTNEELTEFNKLNSQQLEYLQKTIEKKFLLAANAVISGEAAGKQALEQASKMAAAVYDAESQTLKSKYIKP